MNDCSLAGHRITCENVIIGTTTCMRPIEVDLNSHERAHDKQFYENSNGQKNVLKICYWIGVCLCRRNKKKKNCRIIFRWNWKITINSVLACEKITNLRSLRIAIKKTHRHTFSISCNAIGQRIGRKKKRKSHCIWFVILNVVLCVAQRFLGKLSESVFRNQHTFVYVWIFI